MHERDIVNKKTSTIHGEYIGRPSPLGNPFSLEHSTREKAIELSRVWLRQEWKRKGSPAQAELLRLARDYTYRGVLHLVCWCTPQACHGEVVRDAVMGILQKGLV